MITVKKETLIKKQIMLMMMNRLTKTPLQNVHIKSQSHENIRNRILLKRFTIKLIDLILSNIVRYKKNISAEDFINKKTETKNKWNQIRLLSMESMLGANCRIPLIHMSKRKIWIEETNQRINEFSFGYMFNPYLYTNKVLYRN